MNHLNPWKTVVLDDSSMWPAEVKVALPPAHTDQRGYIQLLLDFPMKNVSIVHSQKGSVRANHYHLTDWHYVYVLSGSFDYYYRPSETNQEPSVLRVTAGEMVFTPPKEAHALVFLEETTMVAMSRNPRDQESYEADVRRVTLIDPQTVSV